MSEKGPGHPGLVPAWIPHGRQRRPRTFQRLLIRPDHAVPADRQGVVSQPNPRSREEMWRGQLPLPPSPPPLHAGLWRENPRLNRRVQGGKRGQGQVCWGTCVPLPLRVLRVSLGGKVIFGRKVEWCDLWQRVGGHWCPECPWLVHLEKILRGSCPPPILHWVPRKKIGDALASSLLPMRAPTGKCE